MKSDLTGFLILVETTRRLPLLKYLLYMTIELSEAPTEIVSSKSKSSTIQEQHV
jgi:hypothetical protein